LTSGEPHTDTSATLSDGRQTGRAIEPAIVSGDPVPLAAELELERDAVAACAALIRFDTSNFGGGQSRGERDAAEWVASELRGCGYEPEIIESAPGRASTVVRIPGRDRTRAGLLVHGHLDVVPAESEDWTVDPFGGEIRDGAVWGRGALDMKGNDATMLAAARALARDGVAPPRDVVLAFLADEEDSGHLGAGYLVRERPEMLAGVTHAIGEGGGRLHRLPDGSHLYPVACGERGTAWIELTARGTAGHGSRPRSDNAVSVLADTVARLAAIRWPVRLIAQVAALLEGVGMRLGAELDPYDPMLVERLGEIGELVAATLSNTLSPTMLSAGYAANVVPSSAVGLVDGRMLPGCEDEFFAAIEAELPSAVSYRLINDEGPIATDPADPELELIAAAVRAHDADALVLPCCAGGGTDAKWFSRLGIDCYGFAPERMARGFELGRLVHGVDEHVPVESLAFGARVLDTYLRADPDTGLADIGRTDSTPTEETR
jgi:acetylornithine deacetylase/succinyl-diaminopimelate desuccinylase-like protein